MASSPKLPVLHPRARPPRPRHDGLERSAQPVRGTGEHCSERQIAFIEKLADCGSVSAAVQPERRQALARTHALARPLRAQLWQLPAGAADRSLKVTPI